MRGWVYVLTNDALPGKVKIGFTDRDPRTRAAELSSTSIPMPYSVVYEIMVHDAWRLERSTHHFLAHCRTSADREFFDCTVSDAIYAIKECIADAEIYEEVDHVAAAKLADATRLLAATKRDENVREQNRLEAMVATLESEERRKLQRVDGLLKAQHDGLVWLAFVASGGAFVSLIKLSAAPSSGALIACLIVFVVSGFYIGNAPFHSKAEMTELAEARSALQAVRADLDRARAARMRFDQQAKNASRSPTV